MKQQKSQEGNQQRKLPPFLKNIKAMMKLKKLKGSPKDYVVLSGEMMMDYRANYKITRIDDVKHHGSMLLLHKRNLYRFIKEEQAKMFWHRTLGVRAALPKPKEKEGQKEIKS